MSSPPTEPRGCRDCYHTKRRTRQEPRRARPHDRRTAPLRSRRRRTPSRCHGGTAKRPRSRCEPAARARTQRRSASPRRGGTPRGAARMSGGDGGNRTPVRRWCNRTSPGAVRWRFSQPRARRTPLDPLLAQADEQIGELGRGQPRGILHDDGPFLMRLLTIFHQPSYLMGSGHHNIDSRKCTQTPTE